MPRRSRDIAEPVEIERLLPFRPGGAEEFLEVDYGTPVECPLMPGTYSQLLLHIVFSTKTRRPWITADLSADLYPYIGGIVRAERGTLLAIGGVEDHVHLYVKWRTDGAISDLMRTVKARSSLWVHQRSGDLKEFAWQEGYSVFTVSKSREEAVKAYVAGQAEHHKKESFKGELIALLKRHGVEYDERYVFE